MLYPLHNNVFIWGEETGLIGLYDITIFPNFKLIPSYSYVKSSFPNFNIISLNHCWTVNISSFIFYEGTKS